MPDLVFDEPRLAAVYDALDPDRSDLDVYDALASELGRLVFESRRPERQAWREWTRDATHQREEIDGAGLVETWDEVTDVSLPFVTFRSTIIFHADGVELTSQSTLRFRTGDEISAYLDAAGFKVEDVREAPDRPGKENVFVASRR